MGARGDSARERAELFFFPSSDSVCGVTQRWGSSPAVYLSVKGKPNDYGPRRSHLKSRPTGARWALQTYC
jgi:hypothetical protein